MREVMLLLFSCKNYFKIIKLDKSIMIFGATTEEYGDFWQSQNDYKIEFLSLF